jgi:3-oxoacyl-[acyl-carrier-protein] synthase-3
MIPARHTHGPFTSLRSTTIGKYRKNLLIGIQNRIIESIKKAVQFNNIAIEDISWFIPHQANLRMFQSMAKTLKIPFEKFYVTLHKYGNISSASCAIAFDEAARDGSIKKNDLICLPVFGGGLTWGSALIRW